MAHGGNKTQDEGLIRVKAGLGLFALAVKNFALYPEANHIRRQSLLNFIAWLASFLEEYEKLTLTVEKDRLLVGTEVVFQDKPGEQTLVYPLFRDGIQWFEFTPGTDEEELGAFINLVNRFRILKEEAADDLATALWEADLPHIKYKTADEFWESDPMADIAALKAAGEEAGDGVAAAFIRTASNTVGYVLRALAKDQGSGGGAESTGLAPGQGVPAGEGIGGGEAAGFGAGGSSPDGFALGAGSEGVGEAPGTGAGQAPGPGQIPGAGPGVKPGARPGDAADDEGDAGAFFEEVVAGLDDSRITGSRKPLAGVLSLDGTTKPRVAQGPVYLDKSAEGGSQIMPLVGMADDDDDDGASAADASTARSVFKASSYYESEESEYLWPLAPGEEQELRAMIAAEEGRDFSRDCLEILTEMIKVNRDPVESLPVLDFLADEVQYALSQGDFHFTRLFIEQVRGLVDAQPGFGPLWAEFQKKIITPEVLGVLTQPWPAARATEAGFAELRAFLFILPPEAIYTLVPILSRTPDQRVEKILVEAVAFGASRLNINPTSLIAVLKPSAIVEMIRVFKSPPYRPAFPAALVVGLSRHESAQVREEAARALLEYHPDSIKSLFHLIDDSHPAINQLICDHLGRQRSPLVEKVLTDYLTDAYLEKKNQEKEHVLNCYRAFGLCASAQSIGFLQDILMKKDWKSLLGLDGHWHRLGAALALMSMPKEWGAGEVLKAAQQSRFRNIRQACQQAEEEYQAMARRHDQ